MKDFPPPRPSYPPHKRYLHFVPGFAALVALCLPGLGRVSAAPLHVYMTWQGNTSTTLTVNFHTDSPGASVVRYDTQSRAGNAADYALKAEGTSHQIPGLNDRWIHVVELTGLKPGGDVFLVAGNDENGFSGEKKVRTIADDGRKIRFVTGGDMDISDQMRELLVQGAKMSPDFGAVGGDIAYGNGLLASAPKWERWLQFWEEAMVTPEGYSVPLILAIGNHEVRGGWGKSLTEAPFFSGYFAQSGEGTSYGAHQFGKNLLMMRLDSGHASPHGGAQTAWMREVLTAHADVPQRMAIYHVPLYPSHRGYEDKNSAEGRKHWLPVFDEFKVKHVFENHDHTYKRTQPLKGDKAHPEGTVFFGDGCWGVVPRIVAPDRWYLEQTLAIRHFWIVDVTADRVEARAVDIQGRIFDVYPADAEGRAAAEETFRTLTVSDRLDGVLQPAITHVPPAERLENGWLRRAEAGIFKEIPDPNTVAFDQIRLVNKMDPDWDERPEDYVLFFDGLVHTEKGGDHIFNLRSDDGSKLWVDDCLLVNLDGLHPSAEQSITVNLAPGIHTVRVAYLQGKDKKELKLLWQKPGAYHRDINASGVRALRGALRPTAASFEILRDEDDAEEFMDNHDLYLDSTDLELGRDKKRGQIVGLRFPIDIGRISPQILGARLHFGSDEGGSGAVKLRIQVEPEGTAPFAKAKSNLSSRTTSKAQVVWSPPAWKGGDVSPLQISPDLTPLIQEAMAGGNWSQRDHLVFLISAEGPGTRVAASAKLPESVRPRLVIHSLPPAS